MQETIYWRAIDAVYPWVCMGGAILSLYFGNEPDRLSAVLSQAIIIGLTLLILIDRWKRRLTDRTVTAQTQR